MAPDHIQVVDHGNGTMTFICIYCLATVGPIAPRPDSNYEIHHDPACCYLEAYRLNRMLVSSRHDQ